MIKCESCKKSIEEEAITWPSEHGVICQECWEAECDESWWEMLGNTQQATPMKEGI